MLANSHSGTAVMEAALTDGSKPATQSRFRFEYIEAGGKSVLKVECDKFFDNRFSSDVMKPMSEHDREESRDIVQSKNTSEEDALVAQLLLIRPKPLKILGVTVPKRDRSQVFLMWPFDPDVQLPVCEIGEEVIRAIVQMPYFLNLRPRSVLMTVQGLHRDLQIVDRVVVLPEFLAST